MFDSFSPLMSAYNFAPPDPELVGEKWSEIWQERLENSRPWGIGYISHPLDGPYWQDRSLSTDYSRVKCPVFVIAGWSDCYSTALLRAFSQAKGSLQAGRWLDRGDIVGLDLAMKMWFRDPESMDAPSI